MREVMSQIVAWCDLEIYMSYQSREYRSAVSSRYWESLTYLIERGNAADSSIKFDHEGDVESSTSWVIFCSAIAN